MSSSRLLCSQGPTDPYAPRVSLLKSLAGLSVSAAQSGILKPTRPDRVLRLLGALRHGPGLSLLLGASAARYPHRKAIIDDRRSITFSQLDRRASKFAGVIKAVDPDGKSVAVLCRNHIGCIEAIVAASRSGRDVLLVNTELRPEQLMQVLERESPGLVIHDSEYDSCFPDTTSFVRLVSDSESNEVRSSISELSIDTPPAPPTFKEGKLVLLTSGTTGLPKGAPREIKLQPLSLLAMADSMFSRLTVKVGEPVLTSLPIFHLFGLGGLALSLGFGCPYIIHRKFDPERMLEEIDNNNVGSLFAVPTMLQRMLDLPQETRRRYDTSSLRMVVSGAAPLSAELAEDFMDEFGDVLVNGYGSTESGIATLAGPKDLRAAPGTVGKALGGVPVRILDPETGEAKAPGEVGALFVGGPMVFEGYTSDTAVADLRDGVLNTGDLGHINRQGYVFIDGRQDDMIVSGGENVFPQEIENVLASHPAVADATSLGVPDPEFGQRVRGFVALHEGQRVDSDELVEYVRERLERYKTPREVLILKEIPRNPTGKVLRRVLPTD